MSIQRALKRGEIPPDPMKLIKQLDRRLADVEAALCVYADGTGHRGGGDPCPEKS
jgi:hypothetical protein